MVPRLHVAAQFRRFRGVASQIVLRSGATAGHPGPLPENEADNHRQRDGDEEHAAGIGQPMSPSR